MGRLTDLMLTTDPAQRLRLVQSWMALLFTVSGVALMNYYAWTGVAPQSPVQVWSVATLGGASLLFVLVRSGWSRRLSDPALTLPNIFFSMAAMSVAYGLAGEGRGAVFPAVMVALMFGVFTLRGRQMVATCVLAVLMLAVAMAWAAASSPAVYRPPVEWGHLYMIATMAPAVAALAWRFNSMHQRLRAHRLELSQAMAQLNALATCDDLTGLPNRRFMQEIMNRHLERVTRTGRDFCLVLIDVDHFKSVNDRYGHAMGDTVLATLAKHMKLVVRGADELGRWGGEEFVVLMPETNAIEATVGVERLRRNVQQAVFAGQEVPFSVTVSAGIAQHFAGESIAQTLERADQALYAAKSAGRNCAVVAETRPTTFVPPNAATTQERAPPLQ